MNSAIYGAHLKSKSKRQATIRISHLLLVMILLIVLAFTLSSLSSRASSQHNQSRDHAAPQAVPQPVVLVGDSQATPQPNLKQLAGPVIKVPAVPAPRPDSLTVNTQ